MAHGLGAALGVGLDRRHDGGSGAVITEVEPDSPAAAAGVQVDDVVVAVDGAPIDGAAALVATIRDAGPGATLDLSVVRAGETVVLTATLVRREEQES